MVTLKCSLKMMLDYRSSNIPPSEHKAISTKTNDMEQLEFKVNFAGFFIIGMIFG